MRLLAADHLPGLAIAPPALPGPWVLPSGLPRAHRDRLVALLARALGGAVPDLALAELRWGQRGLVETGRLRLPEPALVWWRIGDLDRTDPREVLGSAHRIAPGLAVFDFDRADSRPHGLPALGWLGPLKLEVLRRLTDLILDRLPVPEAEAVVEVFKQLCEQILSPIDLLDAADHILEGLAEGLSLAKARAVAIGRVIADRFPPDLTGEVMVGALLALAGRQSFDSQGPWFLTKYGLMDQLGQPMPPASLLTDEEVLKATLRTVARSLRLSQPLASLAPGLIEPASVRARIAWVNRPPALNAPATNLSLLSVESPSLAAALDLLRSGVIEEALQHLGRARWDPVDTRSAAETYRALAYSLVAVDEQQWGGKFERPAALLERAGVLFEASQAINEAIRARIVAGNAYRRSFQPASAWSQFLRAGTLAQQVGQDDLIAEAFAALADVMETNGAWDQAIEIREREVLPRLTQPSKHLSRLLTICSIASPP